MEFAGEIALVTGASRGIGAAIARALAQEGATVVGTSTSPDGAAAIGEALAGNEPPGRGMVLDVTQPVSIETLMRTLEEQKLMPSILVNNAAITRQSADAHEGRGVGGRRECEPH